MTMSIPSRLVIVLGLAAPLAGCGDDSALMRFLFSPPAPTLEPKDGWPVDYADPRALAPTIDTMVVERTLGGVIVHVSGTTPTPGYYAPQLVIPDAARYGQAGPELRLDFRVETPTAAELGLMRQTGPQEILASVTLTDKQLTGVTTITVVGAQNSRSVRR